MFANRLIVACTIALTASVSLIALSSQAGETKKSEKKAPAKEVWTDASDSTLPIDFKFQGEYVGNKIGCQVIALADGNFQAVVCHDGLPGAGWNGREKSLLQGKLEGSKVVLSPAAGKRRYLAQSPLEFSATAKFPPTGQQAYAGEIVGDVMTIKGDASFGPDKMTKTIRKSPTLDARPTEGALVLFDGNDTKEWNGGRLDTKTGFLNTDGNDITTKRKFTNYTAHLEFLLPYRPAARGQGRGNSGFYQVDLYEVQILDSFGLEGKNNECGGIYERADCKVNMCLPPLQWQSYDVEFTSAVREGEKVVKKARITVRHNGVVIHDDIEIKSPTGGSRKEPEGTPGVLRLQGHGNPLQFKNIWVVEKK